MSNITSLQNHEIIFHTIDPGFNFDKQSFKYFPKIVLSDSINSYFPVAEVYLKDQLGIIPERIYFIEGMPIKLQIGNADDGYCGLDYAWAGNQFNDVVISNNLSGNNIFILVSKNYFNNGQKSRSYQDIISNIIDEICTSDYGLDSTKKFISTTVGKDYFYQGNIKTSQFIEDLADQAYSQNNPKSPFYTFFNSNGEFYFKTVNELFAQKVINPKNPYLIKQDQFSLINPYYVQDYWLQYLGAEYNYLNYKIKTYKHKSDLSVANEILDYKNYIYRDGTGKLLIRKNYQKINRNLNLGLYDNENDIYRFQGITNNLYRNSVLPIRTSIVTHFNPLMVCGKTVDLEVQSGDLNKGISKEFSGKWLVMATKHYADEDALPYTEALLAKSTIHVEEKHAYKQDFL